MSATLSSGKVESSLSLASGVDRPVGGVDRPEVLEEANVSLDSGLGGPVEPDEDLTLLITLCSFSSSFSFGFPADRSMAVWRMSTDAEEPDRLRVDGSPVSSGVLGAVT